jgi:1-acyl-sn-glycerol-3-phosphate acyltransferase
MKADLILYRAVRSILAGFARIFWRLEIHGREHVPSDGPFVLAPVHRSNIDFLLASTVTKRRMRFMGKDSLWKYASLGKIWTALGAYRVRRGTADREALRQTVEAIQAGEPAVIFPEGTRRSGPVVENLFDGAAYVAAKTGVPIIPVGIGGSEAAMPKGSKLLRPVKIVVTVGKPIEVRLTPQGRVSRSAVRETTEELQAEIQRLYDEAQALAGVPKSLSP